MTNNDHDNAHKKGAYEFLANGGGAITMRFALSAMGVITLTMVGWMWSDVSTTLHDLKVGQQRSNDSIVMIGNQTAINSTQIAGLKDGQQRMWSAVSDQGNRLTHLEACQPHCQPR